MIYVFLIMAINSNTSNMQVEPMEDLKQCRAAIDAIKIADGKSSWGNTLPRVGFIDCIEVTR